MNRAFAAVIIAFALAAPAAAADVHPFVIRDDDGGVVQTYMDFYRRLEATGIPVVLDGDCASACTIVLHLPPAQLCATPRARLGFHDAAWNGSGKTDRGTTVFYAHHFYPPAVAAWFLRQKFGRKNAPVWRRAVDLGVRPCP